MRCKVCGKGIHIRRNFINFFDTYKPEACKNCFKSQMNYFPYFTIPIDGGLLHVFELLKEMTEPNDLYLDYFKPYYHAYLKTDQKIDAIYVDILDSELIDLLDKLTMGHLIIFTNNCKEDKKI